ncbi:MAG: 50S ribosomal protein L18 [Thermoplasmata archaeon]|nr:50S ribosomal protein L18 [Thermoplasmata archaeon]
MSRGPRYRVPFRRRRDGTTDYRHRLKLLLSERPRAVVRFSNKRVIVALTTYDPVGDRVVASAESLELPEIGFPAGSLHSTPAAYLTGYLAGLRAKKVGATDAILDAGLRHTTAGGRLLSAVKGLRDAGLEVPCGRDDFPSADRLNGSHLKTPLSEPLETFKGRVGKLVERGAAA